MLEQKLRNRQLKPLQGLGVVLAVIAAVLLGSAFFTRLQPAIGSLSSVGFIAYGCAIAWYLLYWYAMSFVYTASADCLRVCRAYGRRERLVADVRLSLVQAWGAPEQLKQRFPGARVTNATRAQCPFEPLALAYRDGGKTAIMVIQPDEAMRAHLLAAMKRK